MPSIGLLRHYTCGIMTPDNQYLLLGTESGEMIVFLSPTRVYRSSIPVCRCAVTNITMIGDIVYIGCLDGIVYHYNDYLGQKIPRK